MKNGFIWFCKSSTVVKEQPGLTNYHGSWKTMKIQKQWKNNENSKTMKIQKQWKNNENSLFFNENFIRNGFIWFCKIINGGQRTAIIALKTMIIRCFFIENSLVFQWISLFYYEKYKKYKRLSSYYWPSFILLTPVGYINLSTNICARLWESTPVGLDWTTNQPRGA